MSFFAHIKNNQEGIPTWLEFVTDSLIEKIHPLIPGESEQNYSMRIAKTYIYIPLSSISSSVKFNIWLKNYLISKGFTVNTGVTDYEHEKSYDEARMALFHRRDWVYVDMSNQVLTKYIMNVHGEIYSSKPIKFYDIDIFMCSDDGTPPFKASFDSHSINWIIEAADSNEQKKRTVENSVSQIQTQLGESSLPSVPC